MKFRSNRKNIIIGIVLLLIVTISIGYAALSSNLTIKGNSGIKDNRWLIYFDNVVPNLDSITPTNEAVITNAEKTNIDFGVDFDLPGDYYEFDVDIKNDGTIDAAINEVLTSGLSDEQKKYMTFEVKYQDGSELKRCDLLPAQDHVGVRVKVKYSEDITPEMLETIDGNANLHFEVEYIQAFDGCNNLPDVLSSHKVIIDPNGGEYTGDLETTLKMGETVEIGTPTNEGYTFLGWEVSDPSKFNNNIVTMGSRDIRLVAKWEMSGEVIARLNDPVNGEEFPSIQAAIKQAQTDDVIYLVKSTVESPNNNKKVKLDLQGNTVTGQLTNTGDIVVINGSIENISGSAVENTGTFTLGENDGEVSIDSVSLIGTDIGINQNGTFNFYDGFIEGIVGINGDYNDIPVDWYVFVDHNNEKDCQKVYLVETLTRAIAKTIEGGTVYYFNLQDAINTVALNPMDIYAIRDFEAAYTLTVQNDKSAVFDIVGYNITTGYSITNNGTMTLRDSKEEKGSLSPSLTIENNGVLNINGITITETTDNNVINNKNELHITNSTLTAKGGYAVNNTDNGSITLDENTYLYANNNALNNIVENLNINGGNIRGVNSTASINISNSNITSDINSNYSYALALTGTTNNISNVNVNSQGNCLQETSTTTTIENSIMNCNYHGLAIKKGTVTLTNNEITSGYRTIYSESNSGANIVIESGTYKSTQQDTIYSYYSTVTLNNGNILNTGGWRYFAVNANYNSTFIMNGGYVESNNRAIQVYSSGQIYIKGGMVKSINSFGIFNDNGNATITGGEIIGADNGIYNQYYQGEGRKFPANTTISGGSVKGNTAGIINLYSNVTMNGGTITGTTTTGIHNEYGTLTINTNGEETTTRVEGGIYGIYEKGGSVTIGTSDDVVYGKKPLLIGGGYGLYRENGTTHFYDGILKGQTGAYNEFEMNSVPDAYTIKIDHETIEETEYETAYLIPEVNFLRVGEVEYNSISKALNAIETEGTIEMIANGITKVSNEIPSEKNITFDLAGYQLTTTKDLNNKGTLKIIDSSEEKTGVLLSNDTSNVINSSGTLNIDGIKITKDNTSNYVVNATAGEATIKNSAISSTGSCMQMKTLSSIIESVTMTCDKMGMQIKSGNAILTDNEITSNDYTIYANERGVTIEINGGTYKSTQRDTIYSYYSNVTLNNGNILNTAGWNNFAVNAYYSSTFVMNGGYVESNNRAIQVYSSGQIYIKGGMVKSINSFGIFNDTGNATITGGEIIGADNGIYNKYYQGEGRKFPANTTISGGSVKGNTAGIINLYSNVTMNGGTITGTTTTGIHNEYGTLTINTNGEETTPKIEGGSYGIYEKGGTVTIGTLDENVINQNPIIISKNIGMYKESGLFHFYDGILKGTESAYYAEEINTVPDAYTVKIDHETIEEAEYETAYLIPEVNFLSVGGVEYNSIKKAVAAIETEGTIEVIANGITKVSNEIPAEKNITLDLAGYQLTTTKDLNNMGTLKIIDSSEEKTGVLLSNDTSNVINSSGTLNIDGIKITKDNTSNYVVNATAGEATIKNSTISSTGSCMQMKTLSSIIESVTMTCGSMGMEIKSGNVTLINNEITSNDYTIHANERGVTIEINGGTYKSTQRDTIYSYYSNVTLNNGNILNTAGWNNFAVNAYYSSTFVMNGGYVESNNRAIQVYSSGQIYIKGGMIKSINSNAIFNDNGNATITGGEIIGADYGVYNQYYQGEGRKFPANTTISGGSVKGNTAGILNNYSNVTINTNEVENIPKINGGVYGIHEVAGTLTIGENNGNIKPNSPLITGGSYGLYLESGTISFYDGILKGSISPYYGVINNISDNAMPVDLVETVEEVEYKTEHLEVQDVFIKNGDTGYNNLQTAINEAQSNDTLTMVKDVSIFYPVTVGTDKIVTIDTKGKSVYTTKTLINNGNLTLTDTSDNADNYISIKANLNIIVNNGTLNIRNINFNTANSLKSNSGSTLSIDNVNYTSSDKALEVYGTLELTNSNINAANYGVYFYDTSGDSVINQSELTANSYPLYSNSANLIDIDNSNFNGNIYVNNNNQTMNYNTGTITGLVTNKGNMTLDGVNIEYYYDDYGTSSKDNHNLLNNYHILNMKNSSLVFNQVRYSNVIKGIYSNGIIGLTNVDITINSPERTTSEYGIHNYGNGVLEINGGTITVNNATNSFGLYNEGTATSTITSNININGDNTYGIYSNGGISTFKEGTINSSGTNAYGIYANNGEIAMGEYDGRGTSEVIVSQETPLVKAVGTTTGIGVKKVNGLFKFYDGKIVGSTNAKPETTTEVEYNFEATTHIDSETGYEYCVLEYLLNPLTEE